MPDRDDWCLQAECAPNWDLAAAKAKKMRLAIAEQRHAQHRTVAGAPQSCSAPQALNGPDAAMMPPREDWTALDTRIDEMTPAFDTNVTVGLSWGFQLLSPNDTFRSTRWSC
jgi:hypothetical protein